MATVATARPAGTRRARRVGALLVAGVVLLAACGDDDDSAAPSSTTPVSASDADAAPTSAPSSEPGSQGEDAPVTVEHTFGTTEVDGVPQRIVSLSAQWIDVLVGLGVQPVGHGLDPVTADGTFPWQGDLAATSTGIELGIDGSIPLEQIAALDPDLIVASFVATDEAVYDDLTAIAPTIPLLGDQQVDRWQDIATVAGDLVGQPDAAAAMIDDSARLLADTAAELPELAGQTFALANFIPGDSIYVVADPEDGSSVFFQALGMELDPAVLAEADGLAGRVQLSLEQAELLASDLLVLFTNGADAGELIGYDGLPAVQRGAVATLDYADVVGLNVPTPLSIPYSLELIRPALVAAAESGGTP